MQGGAHIVKALVCGIAQAGLHEGPVAVSSQANQGGLNFANYNSAVADDALAAGRAKRLSFVGDDGMLSVHVIAVASRPALEYISTVAYTGLSHGWPPSISEPFGLVSSAFITILSTSAEVDDPSIQLCI